MKDTPGWASPGSAPADGQDGQEPNASGPAEPADRPAAPEPTDQPGQPGSDLEILAAAVSPADGQTLQDALREARTRVRD